MPPGRPEKYRALAREIELMIQERNMRAGDRLLSERTLARRFGVTQLTVRRALNVLVTAELIHKRPSLGNFVGPPPPQDSGQGLVAFLIPEHEAYFYNIFAMVEKELLALNLHPVVHVTNSSYSKESALLKYCEAHGFAAVIAVPHIDCRRLYADLQIPVIFFDRCLPGLERPYVITDDFRGAYSLTEYLLSMGHRRIAHIGGDDVTAQNRLAGWRQALDEHHILIDDSWIMQNNYSRDWGYQAMARLHKLSSPPTALFCGNDTLAAGVIRYLHENGLAVPENYSVTGFGDTDIAGDLDLTSVSQPCSEIAANICRILIRCQQQPDKPPHYENIINATPVIRSSVQRIKAG